MVTKEDVDKAKAAAKAVFDIVYATHATATALDVDVAAYAADFATFVAAWDKYNKLKREYENENGN